MVKKAVSWSYNSKSYNTVKPLPYISGKVLTSYSFPATLPSLLYYNRVGHYLVSGIVNSKLGGFKFISYILTEERFWCGPKQKGEQK
ncbi:MAG: hypothetical protein DRP65_12535 [Planctomycetota bacterium]|nr:MAG: hypothetical protein DRP65_12535 [Planctomycetota bacterium]